MKSVFQHWRKKDLPSMNISRAANTDENKQYLEERVKELGGKRGLEGLTTEWEDPPDKATGTFNLRVYNPGHTDPVVMPFFAYDLRWKTYHPEKGEDVEEFSKNEKKFKAGSYKRKQQWDLRIRQALSGFGQSNNPVGFRS